MKLLGMSEKERRAHNKSSEESRGGGGEYNPGEVSVQSERDRDGSSF